MLREVPKFINRELIWLEFNQRVLDEAHDEEIPVLERLKFLAITASNLDELFRVRVGGLQALKQPESTARDPTRMTPSKQLTAISARVHDMVEQQYCCLQEQLEPGLAKAGIRRVGSAQLDERQRNATAQVFDEEVFGVFTPMAVGRGDGFPLLANQTLNICVQLSPEGSAHQTEIGPRETGGEQSASGEQALPGPGHPGDDSPDGDESGHWPRFAIMPLGRPRNRFITVASQSGYEYRTIEDLVAMHVGQFFPGERVVQCVAFRITRNADLCIREDMAADLLADMEAVLDARKQSGCVRLEISDGANTQTRGFLQSALRVSDDDVYHVHGPLDLASFMQLTSIAGFDKLKNKSWPPRPSPNVDPAIVELKARFDEARNIEWAKSLEQADLEREASRPKYLDELLIQTPSPALDIVRMELGRLGAVAVHMVRGALRTVIHGAEPDLV